MGNEVLQDSPRAVNNVHISPVDPGMLRLQGGGQKIVPRLAHRLSTGALGLKGMSLLHVLTQVEVKVLLDDDGAVEGNFAGLSLEAVQLRGKDGQCIIGRVGDQECDIDQTMWVRKLGKELEISRKIRRGILEGGEDQDPFFVG